MAYRRDSPPLIFGHNVALSGHEELRYRMTRASEFTLMRFSQVNDTYESLRLSHLTSRIQAIQRITSLRFTQSYYFAKRTPSAWRLSEA